MRGHSLARLGLAADKEQVLRLAAHGFDHHVLRCASSRLSPVRPRRARPGVLFAARTLLEDDALRHARFVGLLDQLRVAGQHLRIAMHARTYVLHGQRSDARAELCKGEGRR